MNLYLVKVHERPSDTTVVKVHNVYEYEVAAPDLGDACRRVANMPVRGGDGATRMFRQNPGSRDYVAPDRARFHGVAEFTQGNPASLERALASAAKEAENRAAAARAHGRHQALERDPSNILDCVTLVDTWDDAAADHAALFRAYVEKDWQDEEVDGRSWHWQLHESLAKAGIDGPAERKVAEEAYWDGARELIAEHRAAVGNGPKAP